MHSPINEHHGAASLSDALSKTSAHRFDVEVPDGTGIVQVKMQATDAYVAAELIEKGLRSRDR